MDAASVIPSRSVIIAMIEGVDLELFRATLCDNGHPPDQETIR